MIRLLLIVKFETIHRPRNDCDLPAHIIDIVLDLNIIARRLQNPCKSVANDRIPDVSDMQRTVWICGGVFDDHLPFPVTGAVAFFLQKDLVHRIVYELPAGKEIDIRTHCLHVSDQ